MKQVLTKIRIDQVIYSYRIVYISPYKLMQNKSAIFSNTATVTKTYKTKNKQILTQG